MSKAPKFLVMCSVHKEGVALPHAKQLEEQIAAAYRATIHPECKVRFIWMRMPMGNSWLAGHPSSASTLLAPVPDDTAQEIRESFMSAVCEDWMSTTGCSVNEIIVNAMDMSAAKSYLAMSRERMEPKRTRAVGFRILLNAIKNKVSQGFLAIDSNMP